MIKLLMSWNVRPNYEEEHLIFLNREFLPGLVKLGVQPTDVWYTQFGDRPQFLAGGVAEDLDGLQHALASDSWRRLKKKLLTYVTDYNHKIVRASGEFQL